MFGVFKMSLKRMTVQGKKPEGKGATCIITTKLNWHRDQAQSVRIHNITLPRSHTALLHTTALHKILANAVGMPMAWGKVGAGTFHCPAGTRRAETASAAAAAL